MKLEPNHIDDIFRQRLHDAEMTPPAIVWTNLEHELRQRRRRRLFLWLFAFGIAGAGLWAISAHRDAGADAAMAQKVFSGNKKEHGTTAQDKKLPAATPQSELTNNDVSPASRSETAANTPKIAPGKLSAKGIMAAANKFVPVLEHPGVLTNAGASNGEVDTEDIPPAYSQVTLAAISPLEGQVSEPLFFSRKNILPKAKSFIRKKKDPKYCYDFAQNPNVFMLDAYLGPSFAKRALEASSPAFEPYRQMRLSTEQRDWAFNAGLRGSLLLGRHFLLRTGLHYEQMTEVFEYADPAYVKYIVEIVHIPGEPVKIDTVGVDYGENYTKTYNRYGLLDIPLEVGGEIRQGRFGLSVNAGISFNVLFWKRGSILSQGGKPAPFTPGEHGAEEVFRPRTGLSAGGSAQIFFHLQPRLRLFAEPYFRQVLKPVTLTGQPVGQRYRMSGIKLGLTQILD